MIGMTADDIAALRNGTALSDPKLLLIHPTHDSHGVGSRSVVEAFLAVVTPNSKCWRDSGIAIKIMHNYTNHIAKTLPTNPFQPYIWSKSTVIDRIERSRGNCVPSDCVQFLDHFSVEEVLL